MARVDGSDCCWTHAPERAADRAAARKAGGRARHATAGGVRTRGTAREPVSLGSVADVRALLERTTSDTLALGNSPQRSRTLGALCGVALRALEVGEMEARLAALEERLNAPTGPRRIA